MTVRGEAQDQKFQDKERAPPLLGTAMNSSLEVGRRFVGREREMRELLAGLDEAATGRGRLLLLAGEPGIGKSRLADEFAHRAEARGARVVWGRCWEGGGRPNFWPWVQILRALSRDRDLRALVEEIDRGAQPSSEVRPDRTQTGGGLRSGTVGSLLESDDARFRLFDSMVRLLETASGTAPLVLILDDLHAADRPSLLLLDFLARETRDAPVLLVATYRDTGTRHTPETAAILADLGRGAQTLRVGSLNENEVLELVREIVGGPISSPLASALLRLTGGNPFFVDQIARLAQAQRRLSLEALTTPGELSIPEEVREVVRRRIRPLSAEIRRALAIASVIGREFDLRLLERVSRLSKETLLDATASAKTEGLVVEMRPRGLFRFAHDLIWETVRGDLAQGERLELHRAVGEALEEIHRGREEPYLEALAHHFLEAAAIGCGPKGIHYAARAGDQAMAQLAYEQALVHYSSALEGMDREGDPDERRRFGLLLSLGIAHRKGGDVGRSMEALESAALIAERLDAPDLLAHAAIAAPSGFSSMGLLYSVPEPTHRFREPALRRALERLPAEDGALRAMVLAELALHAYGMYHLDDGAAFGREALAVARCLDDPRVLAHVLLGAHWAAWSPDNLEERLSFAAELLHFGHTTAGKDVLLQGHFARSYDLLELGDVDAAAEEMAAHAQLAGELKQPWYVWQALNFRVIRLFFEGHFAEGERLATEARVLGGRYGDSVRALLYTGQVVGARREQGRFAELGDEVQRMRSSLPAAVTDTLGLSSFRASRAFVYCQLGYVEKAQRYFEEFATNEFSGLHRDLLWVLNIAMLAETCALLHDEKRAAVLYELLVPFAGRNVLAGLSACHGPVARYLGLLATTMGHWQEAEQHFAGAIEASLRMRARPSLARARYDYAAMRVARDEPGDRDEALRLFADSLALAEPIGMSRLVEDIGALKDRLQAGSGARSGTGSKAAEPEPPAMRSVFRKEGDYWTIGHEGSVFRLKDAKGLTHLSHLLSHPNREFHVLDMVAEAEGTAAEASARTLGGAGDIVLDRQARAAYKARLEELRDQLEEAERNNDLGRAAAARDEIDALGRELASGVGLGGRSRKAASAADRARQSVTKTVKDAVRKIAEHSPALGRHLAASIRTGTFCSYAPGSERPVVWKP